MPPTTYEFHIYDAPGGDVSTAPSSIQRIACFDEASAKRVARKLAADNRGPVDVARSGPSPWNDRYCGTAAPRYDTGRATIWERLD